MSKAHLVAGMLLSALASSMISCTPAVSPAPSGGGSEEMKPQYGGTFHMTALSSPVHLFPYTDPTIATSATVSGIYDTLVRYDYTGDYRDELKLLPSIAERWEYQEPNTYTFKIRKGVKFHDGADLTVEDVAWSIEYLRDPVNKFRRAVTLANVDKVEKVDESTVRMTSKGPSPTFIDRLAAGGPSMMSKKAFDRGIDPEREVIGTGPFKLSTFDRRSGSTLVKNEQYWEPGRPYLDKMHIFYNLDFAGAIAAFSARKADVVKVSNKAEFDQIQAVNPDVVGDSYTQNNAESLILKLDRPPFNDVRVRRALHLALNRQEMIDTLSFGLGVMDPPGMNGGRKGGWALTQEELAKLPGYRQPKEQDLAEAKRLLTEAGHPNGLKFTLHYNGSGQTRRASVAQVVSAQLSKVGIQAELTPREDAVHRKAEVDGDFWVTFGNMPYDADTENWPFWLHSKQAKARTGVDDRELDGLLDAQAVEMNQQKRKEQWLGIQRHLLEKLYVVPLVTHKGFVALQPYVHEWGDNRGGQAVNQSWDKTWLEVDRVPPGR